MYSVPPNWSEENQHCSSYVHVIVDLLFGVSELQRRQVGREALSIAHVEHLRSVVPQELLQQAGSTQLGTNRTHPLQGNSRGRRVSWYTILYIINK